MQYLPDKKPSRTFRIPAGAGAAIIVLMFLIGFIVGLALPAGAQADPDANNPGYWGDDCWKNDVAPGGSSWTADADYRLVVLKSANVNDVFIDVKAGDTLTTGSGKDISHMIFCPPEVPPTTTTQPPTTTTVPEQTTTTQPPTTTTQPKATTTTVPLSTTTTEPEATTTTQPEATTTTDPGTTNTSDPGTVVTTTTQPPSELPYTGDETLYMALAGLAALVIGGGALVAERRS